MSNTPISSNPLLDEDERKHLEFIQNIITRMNSNSFTIKGWAVTIVAALLAVFASTQKVTFLAVSILPIFIFWWLDARYLQMERQYRSLFNAVANKSQNLTKYELSVEQQFIAADKKTSLLSTIRADTVLPFYLLLALLAGASIATIIRLSDSKENKVAKMQIVGEVSTKDNDTLKAVEIISVKPISPDTSITEAKKIPIPVNTPKAGAKK